MKGSLWGHEEISQNFFNEIFGQCHSAEKCKRGTLCDFLTSIVLQNIETNQGGPFGAIQRVSKTLIVPKKRWGYVGILSVFSRFWTSVLFCFFFVLDALLRLELLRFEVVEV